MTYHVAVARFGGLQLAYFQGDDKIEEKLLKGEKPLDDIDLVNPNSILAKIPYLSW
jgi:hypothetical protein